MNTQPLEVGLMVPANNTTMEAEILAWLPQGSRCRTLRIPRGKGTLTAADLPPYIAEAMKLAAAWRDADIDLVAYGCTAAGFLAGPERDAAIQFELAAVTGKPVVTTASAMTAVLQDLGAQRIAVITPYLDPVNDRLRAYLADSGIAVEAFASFKSATTDALAAITAAQVAALARDTMTPRCEAMFIACSQLPTHAVLDGLERDFGRPVWSSIKATAWHAGAHAVATQGRRFA